MMTMVVTGESETGWLLLWLGVCGWGGGCFSNEPRLLLLLVVDDAVYF